MTYSKYHSAWKDFPDTSTPILAAALDHIEDGIATASAAASGGPSGTIWLQDYGADNTGATYSDQAFVDAMAEAQTTYAEGQYGSPVITGLPGIYKLGRYYDESGGSFAGPSLVIPSGVSFGRFPGDRTAGFKFPRESGYGTALGMVNGNHALGATSLAVHNLKGSFAPASVTYPQPFLLGGRTETYTGVTGSGTSVTLTTLPLSHSIGDTGEVIANTAFICTNSGAGAWTFDRSVSIFGPNLGSHSTWTHGSTLNGAVTLPAATIAVTSLSGWPTSGQVMIVGGAGVGSRCVTYTGISGNNLTGCTGGTGTIATGASVIHCSPPDALDGVFMGGRGSIDCMVSGFRHATVCSNDHERWGPNFSPSNCYSYVALEAPVVANYPSMDSGNQYFAANIDWHGAYWSTIWISAYNYLLAPTFYGGNTMSFSPWAFWKEATAGVTGANSTIISDCSVYDMSFEALGLGIIGCPDNNGFADVMFTNCNVGWTTSVTSPGAVPPVAEFCVGYLNVAFRSCRQMFYPNPRSAPLTPFFLADTVIGSIDTPASIISDWITRRQVLGQAPHNDSGGHVFYDVAFEGGRIVGSLYPQATGTLVSADGLAATSVPSITHVIADDGATGGLRGVVVAPFSGSGFDYVGAIATSSVWGPVSVRTKNPGDITANSLVRSNGTASAGTVKNASGIGDTNGIIIGRSLTADPAVADGTFGYTSAGASHDVIGANFILGGGFAISEAATIISTAAYLDGSGAGIGDQALKMLIYSDVGGAPYQKLATTEEKTVVDGAAAAWVTFNLTSALPVSAGTYWIMIYGGGPHNGSNFYYETTGGSFETQNVGGVYSSNAISPYGTGTAQVFKASVYANYIKASDPLAQVILTPALA